MTDTFPVSTDLLESGPSFTLVIQSGDVHYPPDTFDDFCVTNIRFTATIASTDLSVTPPTWTSGQGVTFDYTISGANLTQPATVGLYWSADATFDGQDQAAFTTLTQTATGTYTVSPTHDNLTPPPAGSKYLLAVIDPSNAVTESDEPNHPSDFGANNVKALGMPDIVVSGFEYIVPRDQTRQRNGPLPTNLSFKLTFNVSNQGQGSSPATKATLYVSTDSNIDPASDRFIAHVDVPALGSGQTTQIDASSLSLPDLPPAFVNDVYLGLVLDEDQTLLESDTSNNSNRGLGIDTRKVQLHDPVPEYGMWPNANGQPLTFGTYREARTLLQQNRFRRGPSWFALGGWTRPLGAAVLSRFNGRIVNGFRIQARIIPVRGFGYQIELQGAEPGFNPANSRTVFGEPNPDAMPAWRVDYRYVFEWHRVRNW